MLVTILGIAAATALIMLITLLPFMPGSYDPLAEPLSVLARVFGFSGMLLVPVALLWTMSPVLARPLQSGVRPCDHGLIAWSMISAILSMVAFAVGGRSLGLATLALAAYAVFKSNTGSQPSEQPDLVPSGRRPYTFWSCPSPCFCFNRRSFDRQSNSAETVPSGTPPRSSPTSSGIAQSAEGTRRRCCRCGRTIRPRHGRRRFRYEPGDEDRYEH